MMSRPPTMTPLIEDIDRLVDGVPGWSPVDELYTLATLIHASSNVPGDIIEVGSWCGRSTVILARAAESIGDCLVHAIDPFPDRADWHRNEDGSYSFSTTLGGETISGYTEQTVWSEAFSASLAPVYVESPNTLSIFTRVLHERSLSHCVAVHRGTAATFARGASTSFRCRLAFLDGDHGYRAVKEDIRALTPFLSAGAWLCFDDAFSCYEGVDRAITEEVIDSPLFTDARQLTRKLFVARRTTRGA